MGRKGYEQDEVMKVAAPTSNGLTDEDAILDVDSPGVYTMDDARTMSTPAPTAPPLPPRLKTNMGSYCPAQSINSPQLRHIPSSNIAITADNDEDLPFPFPTHPVMLNSAVDPELATSFDGLGYIHSEM
ncbi:uncharacterized protein ARMOST_19712 [Armillaria ostoyae]|uniref:Uncharacterized protein n=1 Tax=Armillaria ostoyae TaxID=47428 RepID=A0A284S5C1_ARMOS|nr:uncharacterized protein ARMOST_19712 [Armillaria ostoyae]